MSFLDVDVRAVVVVDRRPDGALGGQHGDDVEPAGELDVVDREHDGRVRTGQGQRVPDLPDGEHLVLLDDLLRTSRRMSRSTSTRPRLITGMPYFRLRKSRSSSS